MTLSKFDRSQLKVKPLSMREHNLDLTTILPLSSFTAKGLEETLQKVAQRIVSAKRGNSAIILMMGAHVIRSGVQNYLIDLMARGYLSCIAMNGSGIIHDYEFSRIGATTESVARYIRTGEFGLWEETGYLNTIISEGYKKNPEAGLGGVVGRAIETENLPHKQYSLFAAGYKLKIPITVHVGIGYDIIHEHPNCDGAATGALTYNDFLIFAQNVCGLENGVVMNQGSSVMAPEVYLKALSMARNVAIQDGREIKSFTTMVADLHDLPNDFSQEPPKDTAAYYFRPWKTMLVRTVADGGASFYVKANHSETVPALWAAINDAEKVDCEDI